MPHQCVRCNEFYADGDEAILKGCKCGAKLFFYIKKERMEREKKKLQAQMESLTDDERLQIEHDVKEMIGAKEQEEDKPIVLDVESIRVINPGKYELDLVQLFKGEPIVYKLEEGKYVVDIVESFEAVKRAKKIEDKLF